MTSTTWHRLVVAVAVIACSAGFAPAARAARFSDEDASVRAVCGDKLEIRLSADVEIGDTEGNRTMRFHTIVRLKERVRSHGELVWRSRPTKHIRSKAFEALDVANERTFQRDLRRHTGKEWRSLRGAKGTISVRLESADGATTYGRSKEKTFRWRKDTTCTLPNAAALPALGAG